MKLRPLILIVVLAASLQGPSAAQAPEPIPEETQAELEFSRLSQGLFDMAKKEADRESKQRMQARFGHLVDELRRPLNSDARKAILQRQFDRIDPVTQPNATTEPWYRAMLQQERDRLRQEIERLPTQPAVKDDPAFPEPVTPDERIFARTLDDMHKVLEIHFDQMTRDQIRSWPLLEDTAAYLEATTPREGRIAILKRDLTRLSTKTYWAEIPFSPGQQEEQRRLEEGRIREELKALEEQEGKSPAK